MSQREYPPFIEGRLQKLPRWAQAMISDMRIREINTDMGACLNADVRRTAKRVLGGNCTFSDDDLSLLACLAVAAIDGDLHRSAPLPPEIIERIDKAAVARKQRYEEDMQDMAMADDPIL